MAIIKRSDSSAYLYHLTSRDDFFNIINNTEMIKGNSCKNRIFNEPCISFTESPLDLLARHLLANKKSGGSLSYDLYGFGVKKSQLFNMGGRHAIYQPREDYDKLPEELKFRHVTYNLSNEWVDWSWEREWILKKETLNLKDLDTPLLLVRYLSGKLSRSTLSY